jgi:hypothetical protein
LDARLAGCPEDRLGASRAICIRSIVLQLANRRIVQRPSISIPKGHTRLKFCGGADARQIALAGHLVLVRIQKGQRAGEFGGCIGLCEVVDLCAKVLVENAIVEVAGGEALGMALQGVYLFNLTAVREAYVTDAKVCVVVVAIRRDLACAELVLVW